MSDGRVLVWFSCGAASAVAAKVAVERYRGERTVEVVYCDLSGDEHPDNARFLSDVERWVGQSVIRLRHPEYSTVEEAWLGERFVVSPFGASCTRTMKRELMNAYAKPEDDMVLGFTADERDRIDALVARRPDERFLWLLADAGITKEDCYHCLSAHGIKLPAMYHMGYDHNNCIGCCKGGKGYWNKIRRDFPDVFEKRAAVFRALSVQLSSGGELYWLDELGPDEGRAAKEPNIECGLYCEGYRDLIREASEQLSVGATIVIDSVPVMVKR